MMFTKSFIKNNIANMMKRCSKDIIMLNGLITKTNYLKII